MSNPTETPTLTDFLLARIAEDQERRVDRLRNGHLPTPRELREADRWQAECEAKRRIVEWAPVDLGEGHSGHLFRILALPYADHPGYREEWRP